MSSYGEMCDHWDLSIRRSSRERRCQACGSVIAKGDLYAREAMVFDADWSIAIRCGRCEKMYSHLQSVRPDRETCVDVHLMCGHSYEEVHEKPPPDHIAALAFLVPAEASALLEDAYREQNEKRNARERALRKMSREMV